MSIIFKNVICFGSIWHMLFGWMEDKNKLVNIHKKLIWVAIIFFLYQIFKKMSFKCTNWKKILKIKNLPVLGKKMLKLKEKTYLIEFYVLFYFILFMSCGAFDESIWGIWETMLNFFCRTHKSPLWIGFQRFFMIFLWCVLMLKVIFDMGPISSFA